MITESITPLLTTVGFGGMAGLEKQIEWIESHSRSHLLSLSLPFASGHVFKIGSPSDRVISLGLLSMLIIGSKVK